MPLADTIPTDDRRQMLLSTQARRIGSSSDWLERYKLETSPDNSPETGRSGTKLVCLHTTKP